VAGVNIEIQLEIRIYHRLRSEIPSTQYWRTWIYTVNIRIRAKIRRKKIFTKSLPPNTMHWVSWEVQQHYEMTNV